ncbi:ABC transporter G family member 10-like [Wolffia australiana]
MELPVTAPETGGFWIETKSVSYRRPEPELETLWRCWRKTTSKPILRDVTITCKPGEITAIVGPSGAGKSSLLSVLSGAAPPSSLTGDLLLNGLPMDSSFFRQVSGYVPQEDALFPLLTVRETILFSARLRLSATLASARTEQLLRQLALEHAANAAVGGALSGGERRRVSIAVALVHRPPAVLLDEPTSGLDSASAAKILSLLKAMATAEGKTVVLTLHQPGFRALELIDKVVLLAGGEIRHRGTVALLERRLLNAGHPIPPRVNALEYAMEDPLRALPNEEDDDKHLPFRASHAITASPLKTNIAAEVMVLHARTLLGVKRSNQGFPTKMAQSLVAGLVLGSVFINADNLQARVGFFAFSLTFLLSSTAATMAGLLKEREAAIRETSRGAYRLSSYVLAGAAVSLPLLMPAALLYAAPAYWLAGLRREMEGFVFFWAVAWAAMAAADSLVFCVAAAAPSAAVGCSAAAALLGCFFLFSGYFISKRSMPRQWVFMHYLSLFKYPFEAFLVNEYGGERGGVRCLLREGGEEGICLMDGEMFLRREGLVGARKWVRVGGMLGFVAGYRFLGLPAEFVPRRRRAFPAATDAARRRSPSMPPVCRRRRRPSPSAVDAASLPPPLTPSLSSLLFYSRLLFSSLLELDMLRDALVGLPGVNGLSTEQRKRFTVAVELVANPSIIFMDEPTSGLDARSAAIVMRTVRNTVNTGRTVVCTIHQPSIDIFESFDELLLMKLGGQVIYAGQLGRSSQNLVDYFEVSSLAEYQSFTPIRPSAYQCTFGLLSLQK